MPPTSEADHRYACALRCLCNAIIALGDRGDRLRQHAAACWINRATQILSAGAPMSALDRARLAAVHALFEDARNSVPVACEDAGRPPPELRAH